MEHSIYLCMNKSFILNAGVANIKANPGSGGYSFFVFTVSICSKQGTVFEYDNLCLGLCSGNSVVNITNTLCDVISQNQSEQWLL